MTRSSARRLWHYAIIEHESRSLNPKAVQWQGNIGLIKTYQRGKDFRYDFALRKGEDIRIFYGVTEEGLHGAWQVFARSEDDE